VVNAIVRVTPVTWSEHTLGLDLRNVFAYSRYSISKSPLSAHFSTELGRDPVIVYTYK
jgi:hypothetical protein